MSILAQDIIDWVTSQTHHPLYEDEGVAIGPARQPITGVTVCWMPDVAAARFAAEADHQLVIHHEALTYPYPFFTTSRERQYLSWPTNAARLKAYHDAGLTSCRLHVSADEISNLFVFMKLMGVSDESMIAKGPGFFDRVFEIEPISYGDLIQRVKQAIGMEAVRVTCVDGLDRVIRKVGMGYGGIGLLANVDVMNTMIELGAECVIGGETCNYGMRFCAEAGVDLIETSHETSEIPGMADLAEKIAAQFPQIEVKMFRQPCVWQMA